MGYASRHPAGPPAWFVFLIGVALVFGVYYLWSGVRDFLEEGARLSPTQQALRDQTATVEQRTSLQLAAPTRRPTLTPIPECQTYLVDTDTVNVREQPGTEFASLARLPRNTEVCVIGLQPGTDWFLIDQDTSTRRIEPGYIRADLLRSTRPTAVPTGTPLPPPSITPLPSATPTPSWTPGGRFDPTVTPVPATPTPSRTPTPASINA
ncbi:MAG: SH3 domain-containing protein [Anaerolineae bacterium]|jgi:hypothetical protein|nr:SH3 domain-containing protein [Anaerolineae bacterium]